MEDLTKAVDYIVQSHQSAQHAHVLSALCEAVLILAGEIAVIHKSASDEKSYQRMVTLGVAMRTLEGTVSRVQQMRQFQEGTAVDEEVRRIIARQLEDK